MKRRYTRQWWLGIAAGAAAAVTLTMLVRRQRAKRLALAGQIENITQHAIAQLGVAAESRLVPANGLQLHTVIAGPEDGPLVVLLHGFPECWFTWRKQIVPLVKAGYRVVVPDQRGYNLSDKPAEMARYQIDYLTADVRELIRAMGREQAILVAHDWGGAVAWRFAMDYPHMVEKLVVMNAPHPVAFARELHRGWSQRVKSWYMTFFQLPWLPEALLDFSPPSTARLFFRGTAARKDAFSNAELTVMAAALAQPGALTNMINWYRAAFRLRPAERNKIIASPTLLIWAEDDVALGRPLTHGLEKWIQRLTLYYIPHCGHWVQNEAPDEVNAQLLTFLQKSI